MIDFKEALIAACIVLVLAIIFLLGLTWGIRIERRAWNPAGAVLLGDQ